MEKPKLKIKITPQKIVTFSYLSVTLISLAALAYTALFLYKNFYQAITQSEIVVVLQKEVAISTVNIEKFDEILKKINHKTTGRDLGEINDPFD